MQAKSTGKTRNRMTKVNGHPGIFKRGDRYLVPWKLNGRSQTPDSYPTLTAAIQGKGRRMAGDREPLARKPFAQYAEQWLGTYQGRTSGGVSDGTAASYRDAVERLAVPYFGRKRIGEIKAPDLRNYIAHLQGQRVKGKPIKSATIRRYFAPVRALFATAYEDGVIPSNPAAGVRVFVAGERKRRVKVLTVDEIKRLVGAIDERHRDFVMFLAYTGVRISEGLAARWGDLVVHEGKPHLSIPDSKTEAGIRLVPLAPEFNRSLMRRRASATYAAAADPIFPSTTGSAMDDHNWRYRVWRPAVEATGIEATPHTLRHSLATLLFDRGRNAGQVAAWIGHTDKAFTLRTYVHTHDAGSADDLDDVLGGVE